MKQNTNKGFIEIIALFVGVLAIVVGTIALRVEKGGYTLGTATNTSGDNYPTSSYSFSDNDIVNAGDINRERDYTGIRTSTDTVTLQGQIYNVSTTANNASSTQLRKANNLSDVNSSSSVRTNLGLGDAALTASSTYLKVSNNFSDVNSSSTARSNLNVAPVGTIEMYASSTAPSGWLLADGTEYATSTYTALFSLVGYQYGGSTSTFKVPNIAGRFVAGPSSTLSTTLGATGGATSTLNTASTTLNSTSEGKTDGPTQVIKTVSITNGSTTIATVPPYIILQYIIKF